MKNYKQILIPFLMLLFLGCDDKSQTTIGKIHWDRDMCARCVMVVSDRQNTVQFKDPKTNKQYIFDDIGCMAIWFNENKPVYKDSVQIWITDAKTGKFIDAKTAFYTTNNITPMSFGFSAYKLKEEIEGTGEVINYDEVIKRSLSKLQKEQPSKHQPAMKCGAGKCGKS